MSLTWTDAPAAHAAQVYVESSELAESVAKYLSAGFEAGEPGVLVATPEHAGLIEERLGRVEELLVTADAEATLARIMDGAHPSPDSFEQVIGGLIDEVGARFPGRRVRAFGEMVDLLCARGQGDAAVELEELWNRLARTRDFTLLCGYCIDVFDHATQVDTLPQVCRLHTHVTTAPDVDRLAHAVDDAIVGVLGAPGAGQVYSLIGTEIRERRVSPPQLALMWVSEHMPLSAERILAAARDRYRDAPPSEPSVSPVARAARRPVPDAWRATLRKATRTRRLL